MADLTIYVADTDAATVAEQVRRWESANGRIPVNVEPIDPAFDGVPDEYRVAVDVIGMADETKLRQTIDSLLSWIGPTAQPEWLLSRQRDLVTA